MSPSKAQARMVPADQPAQEFNDAHDVGTPVRYWPGFRLGAGRTSHTRTPAWEMPGGQVVVSVEGYSGGIALDHIEVIPAGEIHEAMVAVSQVILGVDARIREAIHAAHPAAPSAPTAPAVGAGASGVGSGAPAGTGEVGLGDAIRAIPGMALRGDGGTVDALMEAADRADALERERDDYRAKPRDEHHTMDELYEYRMVYNALAAKWFGEMGQAVKSWRHHDGELCFGGGWFIVCLYTLDGWVTNHYEAKHWDLFSVPEEETAPEWDGHTPADGLARLRNAL